MPIAATLAGARGVLGLAARGASTAGAAVRGSGRVIGGGVKAMGSMGRAAPGVVGSGLAAGAKNTWNATLAHPVIGGLAAGSTASFIGQEAFDGYEEGLRNVKAEIGGPAENAYVNAMQERRLQALTYDQQMFQIKRREALAKLASAQPQVFNEVSAGRRLPRGARVFGGRPRTDLLEMLASQMASGEFQVNDPQGDLAALLGG